MLSRQPFILVSDNKVPQLHKTKSEPLECVGDQGKHVGLRFKPPSQLLAIALYPAAAAGLNIR